MKRVNRRFTAAAQPQGAQGVFVRWGALVRRGALVRQGVSLVEFIAVIMILAVLVAITAPTLVCYIDAARHGGYKHEALRISTAVQTVIGEHWGGKSGRDDGDEGRSYRESPSGAKMYWVADDEHWPGSGIRKVDFTKGGASLDHSPDGTVYSPPIWDSGLKELVKLAAGPAGEPWGYMVFQAYVGGSGALRAWDYRVPSSWNAAAATNGAYRYLVTFDIDASSWRHASGAGIQVWRYDESTQRHELAE
jgi:prepilin-type N-terminal cleavage/methylation domain-containing protein